MTLSEAQAAFRASPFRHTALAYMDAAIEEWETGPGFNPATFVGVLQEIRGWLMNECPPRDPALWPEGAESQ